MLSLRSALLSAIAFVTLLSLSSAQNLITNGGFETGSLSGWSTPLGVDDNGLSPPVANRLRAFSDSAYGTCTPPCGWAYDGAYSALWESSTLNQSITQTVAVTAGTAYALSFYVQFTDGDTTAYLRVSAQFNDASNTNMVLLTPNGGEGAQQSFCSGSAQSQPPFWWSQFKFTVTPPTGATSMVLTFYGYDSEYGFLLDAVTMTAGSTFPSAPRALTPNPSNNLLINGDFESGSVAPWREAGGDNPFGVSGGMYSGEGAYNFNGFANRSGIPCMSNSQYCFTFGAPLSPLPIQQTISIPSGTTSSYQLQFQWYAPGGYNSSNPFDAGSQLVVAYAWGSTSTGTIVFSAYNTTAVTSATNPNTVTQSLGVPPSGTTSLTIQMQGFFYATYYVVDNVQLTANSVTASQSTPIYTCGSTATPLSISSSSPGKNGAARSVASGLTVATLLAALVMLML